MKLELLNHACLKLEFENNIKLLFDPWLTGYAFEEGWGLKYHNPDSLAKTKDCTHLWISHFHGDHFHILTLKEILKINPDIIVLANHSFNFKMDDIFKNLGFKNVIPFYERKKVELAEDLSVMRYPTTGIDNMLLITSKEGVILNYNDCNVPLKAREKLARKLGKIDILLNNFNHAGKIIDYPLPSDEQLQHDLKDNFRLTIESFQPKFTIPFASFHYYRAPENEKQNRSLMSSEELKSLNPSIVPLKIGQSISFDPMVTEYKITHEKENITENTFSLKTRSTKLKIEDLKIAARAYCKKLNRGFLYITFWIPPLKIKVTDLDVVVSLRIFKGKIDVIHDENYHLSATSIELQNWWAKRYGTDSFVVGGHFDINDNNTFPMRVKFILGLLTENKLDIRSFIKMCVTPSGLRFLWNRREEIVSVILSKNFMVGTRK